MASRLVDRQSDFRRVLRVLRVLREPSVLCVLRAFRVQSSESGFWTRRKQKTRPIVFPRVLGLTERLSSRRQLEAMESAAVRDRRSLQP